MLNVSVSVASKRAHHASTKSSLSVVSLNTSPMVLTSSQTLLSYLIGPSLPTISRMFVPPKRTNLASVLSSDRLMVLFNMPAIVRPP